MSQPEEILICGPNWLGDSIMSMPAIQLFKQRNPDCSLTMLARKSVRDLWRMHPDVDDVQVYDKGITSIRQCAIGLRERKFQKAYVFPNSFRSALLPFLGRVSERIGVRGHQRGFLLNSIIPVSVDDDHCHQAWEYVQIMGMGLEPEALPAPCLDVPTEALAYADEMLANDASGLWVGIMPGAARGPSKRWPNEYFAEVAKELCEEYDIRVVILGSAGEQDICKKVADEIGSAAVNMAGKTSLMQLAALLKACRCVLANDSGGMHLAAALGIPVVAVFGLTDHAKTGPLGQGHRLMIVDGVIQSRSISRNSREAIELLRQIKPGRVLEAAREILGAN